MIGAMVQRFFATHTRQIEPEIMDRPDLDGAQHEDALRGLERLNMASLSPSIVWPAIAASARAQPERRLRVLDIATGGGDIAAAIAARAAKSGLAMDIHGCDISEAAVSYATARAARRNAPVEFFQHDAVADGVPAGYDVVMCSLFLHHLESDDARGLIASMASAAGSCVVINDLERSAVGLATAYLACYTLSRSPVVHHDGVRSVSAGFTLGEARGLAENAGLTGATLSRHWPFRWRLIWRPPS